MATAMPSVSIGNYKGVMLCNRPFVGVAGGRASGGGGGGPNAKAAFVCGKVGGDLGANVPMSSKERPPAAEGRPKKASALLKHKEWLRALQKTREQVEAQHAADAEAKEERQRKFAQREAKMRAQIRDAKIQTGFLEAPAAKEEADDEDAGDAKAEAKSSRRPDHNLTATDDLSAAVAEAKHSAAGAAGRRRPMWALTAEQADLQAEVVEDEEAEDLLNFAQELDFEKYINDSEVAALIDNVRHRISELEVDVRAEAKGAGRKEEILEQQRAKQLSALTADNLDAFDTSLRDDDNKEEDDDGTRSVAASILDSEAGRAIGDIHSKKSLAAVAEARKQRLVALPEEADDIIPPPIIVRHNDEGTSRLDGKNTVQNLPYMHRNPAV